MKVLDNYSIVAIVVGLESPAAALSSETGEDRRLRLRLQLSRYNHLLL